MVTGINRIRHGLVCGLLLVFVSGLGRAETPPGGEQDFVVPVEGGILQSLSIDWPRLEGFYEARQGNLVWHDGGELNTRGRLLYRWLASSDREGLSPADYHVNHLRHLMDDDMPDHRLLRELLLTDGYFLLARDLSLGHLDPRTVDPLWLLPDDPFDPLDALADALERNRLAELLHSLAPANDAYVRLREALARYRAIQGAGGWPRLDTDHTLRPGADDPEVVSLRERLDAERGASWEAVVEPSHFDEALRETVRRYQQRHGLQDDGVVGPETLRALNVPVETRITQLLINLERWRWLPRELAPEYLMVNAAGFEIELVAQDRVVFHKRTVNGTQVRQTPSIGSRVTHLVANPQWTVPRTIAVQDMLPRLQADSGYLQKNRIRVYRHNGGNWEEVDPSIIDWSPYHEDNFPFVLRQDAGAGNSLGRVKFHMPNPYAVFLHDTPAVGLFQRANRALSSGCVRVEGAGQLARLLSRETNASDEAAFTRALESGETLITPLDRPVPVYLTYFTSWVDASGEVNFRPDVYHRDSRLMLALGGELERMTAHHESGAGASSL